MIEFKCPHCAKPLKLPHSYAGNTTSCPSCLRSVAVPGGPAEVVPASASKPRAARQQLCVDCGATITAADAMTHVGQTVCTECYRRREGQTKLNADISARASAAVDAKAKKAAKANPTRRLIRLIWAGVIVVVALTVLVIWLATR